MAAEPPDTLPKSQEQGQIPLQRIKGADMYRFRPVSIITLLVFSILAPSCSPAVQEPTQLPANPPIAVPSPTNLPPSEPAAKATIDFEHDIEYLAGNFTGSGGPTTQGFE